MRSSEGILIECILFIVDFGIDYSELLFSRFNDKFFIIGLIFLSSNKDKRNHCLGTVACSGSSLSYH